jgi:Cu(I)/Ag(I) efflux system membrane fusion protein/cobalt-zinc-cadmium efflux system membrane fusion protein
MRVSSTNIIAIVATLCLALLIPIYPHGAAESRFQAESQLYTCGMHPEIISDQPGYCPVCGMRLSQKKNAATTAGSISIDPTARQNMNLVTVEASYGRVARSVRALGRVEYSEPSIHSVTLKVEGWVENLQVDSEGDRVDRGDVLLEVYSPAMLATQKELLIAHNASMASSPTGPDQNGMSSLMEAAITRLRNWGIADDQIEQIIARGDLSQTMRIQAPTQGVIVSKNVDVGAHIRPGSVLYRIADLSTVWIVAYVYEQDQPFISIGQTANVSVPSLPGEKLQGVISYVSPFFDSKRQVEMRIDIGNPHGLLKPGMYAEVTMRSELAGERLLIPRSTIINSGRRQIAYVSVGDGTYEPRVLQTGVIGDDDLVEVLSGLSAGESVVASGQFLLDSESRLGETLDIALLEHSHGDTLGRQEIVAQDNPPQHNHSHEHMQGDTIADLSGVYTCPMPVHFHVLQFGSGDCSECGMALVPVEKTSNTDVWICPMRECAVAQNQPGRCPVCGMYLERLLLEAHRDR